MKRGLTLLIACAGLLGAMLWWHGHQPQTVQRSRMVMGTLVEISATGSNGLALHRALEEAFAEMEHLEQLFSPHIVTSEVARLTDVTALEVSSETREVVKIGLDVARRSRGAFDMTLGKLVRLWDIGGLQPTVPDDGAINRAIVGIGPEALRVRGAEIVKAQPELQAEFGGIAKGYAIEAAAKVLRAAELDYAAVNAGGDIALVGSPPQRDWRIGIRHPRDAQQLLATLVIPAGAVVTSGDYERFFEVEGRRYHHLFDPRTGYPARGCQSVTVWGADATYADALATAAFVMGPEQGLSFLEAWPGFEGILVTAEGEVLFTRGMKEQLEWP